MTRRRSTFRRDSRQGSSNNTAAFGYRAAFNERNIDFFGMAADASGRRFIPFGMSLRDTVIQGFHAAARIGRDAMAPLPGETHRQMAARLRDHTETPTPAKPARKPRAKKAAA